jgi:hypothetical protein
LVGFRREKGVFVPNPAEYPLNIVSECSVAQNVPFEEVCGGVALAGIDLE